MLFNIGMKAEANAHGAKAVCSIANNATKIATILTNPVAATAVVATTAVVLTYKHLENKDKRHYENATI